MKKLLGKPTSKIDQIPSGKFENYNLVENPFPTMPIVNKDSEEKKFNGSIYEQEIRLAEYNKILKNFIQVPQSNVDHLRLGFIIDTSYIGRGNGKSAFMVNLLREINEEFCLNLSDNQNKCFGTYFAPEPSGNTKTFKKFVDLFFQSIIKLNIINYSLAMLRLDAILALKPDTNILDIFQSETDLIEKLNKDEWLKNEGLGKLNLQKSDIGKQIFSNSFLQSLSDDFPLSNDKKFLSKFVTQKNFEEYYLNLKKDSDKLNFVFTELVNMFLASGFNGAYVFIDDFERIPDFQSGIQRKDFATQIRSVLFDGLFLNSKIGFYNFILALHAGVPRLIQEAWSLAGLEQRVSLNPSFSDPKHIILFDKINEEHVVLLLSKYLKEFRKDENLSPKTGLYPFTQSAAKSIGIISEFNASRILQFACHIIDYASEKAYETIDDKVVSEFSKMGGYKIEGEQKEQNIANTEAIDLLKKSKTDD